MKLHLWNTAFTFFMNASLIILANIHKTVFFLSFFFSCLKHLPLSTTKSCMCVKIDTKQKPPPCSTELRLHDGTSVNTRYPVRVALRSYQPQPYSWPATTICSRSSFWSNLHRELWLAGFVPLFSWLVSCPHGGQMQSFKWLLGATISLHWRESCYLLV